MSDSFDGRGMLHEICCDSCPYSPTCEEENDFLRTSAWRMTTESDIRDWRVRGR